MKTQDRPLSPHLQIYRWQWTMLYSILHRATGIALSAGTLLLVWWLLALASGPEAFAVVQGFIGSIIGQIMLFGWTWSLMYHLGNGIRHLVWDAGYGFDLDVAQKSGHGVAALTGALTILIWIAGYLVI
ncbi:succinate dehydrogenase, cytochrome b556 subunit [Marivibrio halodurans]|uniref:Succinate dehydrogenase cytochrome b556 subunit n=1 Tax=Marivibrio halodurans TaxID=2039722 RepID=A0A8J7S1D2_9PROT|nr:succinate dehydrogenase, cytochrome b556 subunit [Marivibrio halodurans]MBP5858470.1 succinate dehydrogenase, cytochrome b556 subunit [Marivibrio halodurans]